MSNILDVCSKEQKKAARELKVVAIMALVAAVALSCRGSVSGLTKEAATIIALAYVVAVSGLAALKIMVIDLVLGAKANRDNDATRTYLGLVDHIISYAYWIDFIVCLFSVVLIYVSTRALI